MRAIPFEKLEGVSGAQKKMPRGGPKMVPISLRGGLQKCLISPQGGFTTGPPHYCGVVNSYLRMLITCW